jgi:hypothetical protein
MMQTIDFAGGALCVLPPAILPPALALDLQSASGFARSDKAKATRKAYGSDFALFRSKTHYRPPLSRWRPSWRTRPTRHEALHHQPPLCLDPLRPQARRPTFADGDDALSEREPVKQTKKFCCLAGAGIASECDVRLALNYERRECP